MDENMSGYDAVLLRRYNEVESQLKILRGFAEMNEIFTIILTKNDLNLNQLYPLIFKNLDFFFQPNEDINICDLFEDKELILDSCDDKTISFTQEFFGKQYLYIIDHDK
jgi:hypothetical protein